VAKEISDTFSDRQPVQQVKVSRSYGSWTRNTSCWWL